MTNLSEQTSLLNTPLILPCGQRLSSRLAKSAMSEGVSDSNNRLTPEFERLYQFWRDTGLGLIITGNIMVDKRALVEPRTLVVEDDRDINGLHQWAKSAQSAGAVIWAQISHPGKQISRGNCKETVAPSAVPFGKELAPFFGTPRALSEAEILDLINRFANTARIVKDAGFSGAQIHAAHGYLISQFLSPKHNIREDRWGGTPENRRRFLLGIIDAVRDVCGSGFALGVKLNSADFQHGGLSFEESLETVAVLRDRNIDLLEISGGTYEKPAMSLGSTITDSFSPPKRDSTVAREAYFLEFAKVAKAVSRQMPLMLTGGFRTAAAINQALRDGAIDVAGMARPLAIEFDIAKRLLSNEASRHQVASKKHSGIGLVDKTGLLEVKWYARQLHRMAKGLPPDPDEQSLPAVVDIIKESVVANVRRIFSR